MPNNGKWLPKITAGMSAANAAKGILVARLKAVAAALPLAVDAPDEIEHVHQLRVTCRRASTAIRACRYLMPKKARRHAQDLLRSLRRAAGEARNWDVFLDRLDTSNALQTTGSNHASDFLSGYAFRERDAAQVVLAAVAGERGPALTTLGKEVVAAIRKTARPEATFRSMATLELGDLTADVTRQVTANPTSPEDRHRLRISCKRLRYTLEIFAPCLTPQYRDTVAPAVSRLQESLGILQDSHVLVTRLTSLLVTLKHLHPEIHRRVRPGITAQIRESRERATTELEDTIRPVARSVLRCSGSSSAKL